MEKHKFIEELKKLLFEDLDTSNDISPNLLKIKEIYAKYPGLSDNTISQAKNTSNWLETYFMHCRHRARPIDVELATGIINSLDYI